MFYFLSSHILLSIFYYQYSLAGLGEPLLYYSQTKSKEPRKLSKAIQKKKTNSSSDYHHLGLDSHCFLLFPFSFFPFLFARQWSTLSVHSYQFCCFGIFIWLLQSMFVKFQDAFTYVWLLKYFWIAMIGFLLFPSEFPSGHTFFPRLFFLPLFG